jgi:hypothetical protein
MSGSSSLTPTSMSTISHDGPALAVSDHILLMVVHALRRHGLDHKVIRQYAYAVRDLAVRSSGGYHERVPETQTDCPTPKTTRSSISRSWWTRT